jgi:formyl-CoA transferase
MMDATMSFIPDALTFYNDCGIEWDSEFRAGVSHSLVIACANNELLAIHMAGPDRMWHGLAKVAEREDMLTDPRFATRENRVENWKLLIDELRPVFAKRSRAEWMSALISVDVPAAEVLRIPEVMASEGVRHAKMFEQFEHPIAGTMTMIRRAARFDGLRGAPQAPPPMLGEHTAEVLEAIGKGKPFS